MNIKDEKIQVMFEKHPQLKTLLTSGYLRKYQFQDTLGLTKSETDMLIDDLIMSGAIKLTPFGYKMLVRVQKELEMRGLM